MKSDYETPPKEKSMTHLGGRPVELINEVSR